MVNLLKSLLGLGFLLSFSFAHANQCEEYLSGSVSNAKQTEAALDVVASEMVQYQDVYSSTYYEALKSFVSEKQLQTHLTGMADDALMMLSEDIYDSPIYKEVWQGRSAERQNLELEVIFKSLKAIRTSKSYPYLTLEKKTRSKILKGVSYVTLGAGIVVAGSTFFLLEPQNAYMLNALGASLAGTSILINRKADGKKVIKQDLDKLTEYVLSEGSVNNLDKEIVYFTTENGQLKTN